MPDFRNPIQVHVPFDPTSMYDLTGGTMSAPGGQQLEPLCGWILLCVSLPLFPMEQEQNQDQALQWMERDIGIQIFGCLD